MKIPYWPLLVGPILLFGLGFSMNTLVMLANHGQMPVLMPGGCLLSADQFEKDIYHVCMSYSTHLKFLADWIIVRADGIYSPGDLFELIFYKFGDICTYIWAAFVLKDFSEEYVNRN